MLLPDNGKVVIFDDKPEDIVALTKALWQEKIPFLCYQDESGTDLPDSPIENIRLVFLDLELVTNNTSPQNIIATIAARLRRVLMPFNTYILIIWSTKEDLYKNELEKAFNTNLKNYSPLIFFSLDKIKIKNLQNPTQFIREELKGKLENHNSIYSFLLWESIVNNSAGEIVNSFTGAFDSSNKWDENLRTFLYKIVEATVGKDKAKKLPSEAKLQIALEGVSSALIDSVENNIRRKVGTIIHSDIIDNQLVISPSVIININTKLHLLKSEEFEHFKTGNLYIGDNTDSIIIDIVNVNFKEKQATILEEKPKLVKLDVTPSCDYAQDKGYSRLLYGIILDAKYQNSKKNGAFNYNLCPIFNINEHSQFLIFDFRYFVTFKQDNISKTIPKTQFRLRSQLVTDIQAQLASHINRPGIIEIK